MTQGVQCTIHQRAIEGHVLNIVKSEALLQDVSMDALMEVGKELEKYWKYWDIHNKWAEWRMIEKIPWKDGQEGFEEQTQYIRFKMGMMASDRDLLISSKNFIQPDGPNGKIWLTVTKSVDRGDTPELDGVVRMYNYTAARYEQIGNDVRVTEFRQMDLKGYFPTAMMNKICSTAALDSVKSLYQTMKKVKEVYAENQK